MRIDEYNSPIYFIDRDPAHFRHILNYLRLGSSWMPHSLPRELRYLHEIRVEAEFYQLKGLVENLDRRIAILSVLMLPYKWHHLIKMFMSACDT